VEIELARTRALWDETSMTASPTCWAKALDSLGQYSAGRGAPCDALFARHGLTPERLADPDGRVPLTAYYETVEYAAAALDDPHLGLHYIETLGFASSDGLGYLAMFSSTVGEAMDRFIRYLPLLNDGEQLIQMNATGGRAEFLCTAWGPDRPGKSHMVEMFATGFLTLPARVSGKPVEVTSLAFAHDLRPGASIDEYVRVFGRAPAFGADENTWSFAEEVLSRAVLDANPNLAQFFEAYLQARRAVSDAPAPLVNRVRMTIADALRERQVQLGEVARRLGVSERTLQRHLGSCGMAFEELLNAERRLLAEKYLRAGKSISEVSELLGYAEPAVFQRAFKRWTGSTPGTWRDRHRD
jgi:AraC-like DNA-binding protein